MAADTTILSGDVGVWWLSNNRCKMLTWEGTTGTYTINQLYSAMQTLQDESDTIDDGTCFNADTPVEYTIGSIDQNDNDPWYITFDLMEHITGGSLKTAGWTRTEGTDTGIVIIPGTNVDMAAADIGDGVSGTDGDGTLLEIIEGDKGDFIVVRPDSNAAGDSFKTNGQTITCDTAPNHTFTQHATEDNNTGEMIWANLYTIGTVDDNVHMYVYQGEFDASTPASPATDNSDRVYSVNSSTIDYWGEGHIDICAPNKRWWRLASEGAWDAVDSGYFRVYARKGGDLYSSFEVATSTTSGGRNPVPLQTSADLNQGTGTKTVSFTGSITGTFTDGEVITQATSDARGVLDLDNSDTGTNGYLSYFPIAESGSGGLLTAFNNTNIITGDDSGASCTSNGTPADAGPSLSTWFTNNAFPDLKIGNTAVQAVTNKDIDNDGTDEHYGIVVDCNSNPLDEVYEWLKYICQYTQGDTDTVEQAFTDDISQADIFGEEFVGATAYFGYSAISGTLAEGEGLTQATSGATGYMICHDTTNDVVLLRNTRGSFNSSNQIDSDVDADYFTPDEAGNFAATVSSPFGTFAGGTFFGARGIILENWVAGDENSFILTDMEGNTKERPTSITITVSNVHGNAVTETDSDLVGVYLLDGSGGDIDKDLLTCDGGEVEGGTTIATSAIPDWPPSSGRLLLSDVSENDEYIIGYSSYDTGTDTFTLDSATFSALTAGTNANTLVSTTNELDNLDRGDFIWNETRNMGAYVTDVQAGTNTVNLDRDITGQISTDTVKANVVPLTLTASDTVLPLIIHSFPTSGTVQASVIYPGSTMYFRVKVRNSRETDLVNGPIKPYSSDGSTSGTNQTIQTVRSIDTIIS